MHEDETDKDQQQNITINFNIQNIHKVDESDYKKLVTEIEELKNQIKKKPDRITRLAEISKLVIDGSKAAAIFLFIAVVMFEFIGAILNGTYPEFFSKIRDLLKK